VNPTRAPLHRWRQVTWNIPDPALQLFAQAREAFIAHRRQQRPEFDIGEQDFAIHLLVQASREVLREVARVDQAERLVQPAATIPAWAREASERLQSLRGA
jgi:hypothetical protein